MEHLVPLEQTAQDRSFSVSGKAGDLIGNPDPYIQVEYEYSGTYGKMEVEMDLEEIIVTRHPQSHSVQQS